MDAPSPNASPPPPPLRKPRGCLRRGLRGCGCAVGGTAVLVIVVVLALAFQLHRVPVSYPLTDPPVVAPLADTLGVGMDGFDSPYLGHSGSWDGAGGAMLGASKIPDLDREVAMGLRWTFMPVYWAKMEPDGPVDPENNPPPTWAALDAFVIAAHDRKLNILMQAPVMGGNAGGPPKWAGRREKGKSAPENMAAAGEFAAKLAQRYAPGGTLAARQGWGTGYGVRAWEMDNEPESYFTNWKGQAGDYAEFVTLVSSKIKAADKDAVIAAPGMASGLDGLEWMKQTLDAPGLHGSAIFKQQGKMFSIGPVSDVISLHNYEGLDSAFSGGSRTIGTVLGNVRDVMNAAEQSFPGFTYERKAHYWHTEGNFDFLPLVASQRKASWRFQFFTRAFASGLRKVCVMDPSEEEQAAIKDYVDVLPHPFPMLPAAGEVKTTLGAACVFRHPDGTDPAAGQVWVAWAEPRKGAATIVMPAQRPQVTLIWGNGSRADHAAVDGRVTIDLPGHDHITESVLVIDRP